MGVVVKACLRLRRLGELGRWPALLLTAAANGPLLWYFHRRSWYPPDEGNYAHVAWRMVQGEILNRDVQDIHPGYINFLNALALRLFGPDLVSLRYPLMAAAFAQAIMLALLFPDGQRLVGLGASLALTALGVIQFLNPTAHWYCLFLAVAVAAALTWLPASGRARLGVTGFLIGLLTLFRHLSGVFVAMAAVSYLVYEVRADVAGRQTWLGRAIILASATAIFAYLTTSTDLPGWLLFGVWPLALLARIWPAIRVPQREVLRIVAWLGLGAVTAALPLLAYHLAQHSLAAWIDDVVVAPVALRKLGFFRQSLYGWLPLGGLVQHTDVVSRILNGLYWLALPLVAAVNGLVVIRRCRPVAQAARPCPPLSFVAVFYALVSLHYQIPIYLYYTVGLSLASLFLLTSQARPRASAMLFGASVGLSLVAVHYQAGQPVARGMTGILAGTRTPLVPADPLPHCGLFISSAERQQYLDLVDLIHRESGPQETIFALPSNAELYFLSERRNPFRFYNTALGIRDEATLSSVMQRLRDQPPRLVFFNPRDKYNTPASARLMEFVKRNYVLIRSAYNLEIYRLPG